MAPLAGMGWQRLLLWMVTFPFVFLPVGVWLSGLGHTSFAALAMFASWGLLVPLALRSSSLPEPAILIGAAIWLLLIEPLYYWGLQRGSMRLARMKGLRWFLIVPVIHILGGFLLASLFPDGHLVTERDTRFSFLIAIPLLVVFFGLDWLLVQREVERAAGGG